MQKPVVVLALLLLFGAGTSAQTQSGSQALQTEIERLHSQWLTAFDKGDGETMDRIEVPNLVLVFQNGTIWQKSGPRAGKQKPTAAESRTLSNAQVRQFGDTAVLTGRLTSIGANAKDEASTTVVCVRQNGQWLVASAHWSAAGALPTK